MQTAYKNSWWKIDSRWLLNQMSKYAEADWHDNKESASQAEEHKKLIFHFLFFLCTHPKHSRMNLTKLQQTKYEFSHTFQHSLKCFKTLKAVVLYEYCPESIHTIDNYQTGLYTSIAYNFLSTYYKFDRFLISHF